MRRLLAVAVLFAVLTLLFTFPVWTAPDRLLTDNGDPRLNAWILAWDARALVHSPGTLFDANIFHPHDRSLAFSENLLGLAAVVAPVNWLGEPILAYNLALLAGLAIGGLLMAAWVRRLHGSWIAGIVAGVVWSFAPTRTDQLHHIQLVVAAGVPAILWALTVWIEERRRAPLLLAGALLAWQYSAGIHASLVTFPLIALFGVAAWRQRPDPRPGEGRRALADLCLAAGVAAFPIVLVSLPYLRASSGQGFVRSTTELSLYSAEPTSFLAGGWANRAPHMQALARAFGGNEANHFLGVTAILLVAAALVAGWRRRRGSDSDEVSGWRRATARVAGRIAVIAGVAHTAGILLVHTGLAATAAGRTLLPVYWRVDPAVWLAVAGTVWLLLRSAPGAEDGADPAGDVRLPYLAPMLWCALLGYLLSLGMEVRPLGVDLGNGPLRLLYDWVLPYRSLRAPGRFGLAFVTFLAPVAAGGALLLCRAAATRFGSRRAAVAVAGLLVVALVWEYRTWPLPTADGRPQSPEVYRVLAGLPGEGAVLHLPMLPGGRPPQVTEYMIGSTRHWRPLVNGFSGFTPAVTARLAELSPEEPEFWDLVRDRFPVRYVVVHEELLHGPEQRRLLDRLQRPDSGFRLAALLAGARIYERIPEAVASRSDAP